MMGRRSAKRGPTQQRRGQVDLLLDVSAKLESLNSEIRTAAARMGAPEHARQLTGPRVRKGVQHAGFNFALMCMLCDTIQQLTAWQPARENSKLATAIHDSCYIQP